MNSIVLNNPDGIITDFLQLQHLNQVLKLKVGDQVRCTLINQGIGLGKIKDLTYNYCQIELGPLTLNFKPWFDLLIGVSRPQTTKKILEHGTTFGARSFHFFQAELSEKSYFDSKIFTSSIGHDLLINGLSQSATYCHLPTIKCSKYNPSNEYINTPSKFFLDLEGNKSFSDVNLSFDQPITLALGPERGLTLREREVFHQAGFTSVKISSSILRVEHAVYSAVSQLELIRHLY